jgi:FkbM family methyltransferase
MTPQNIFIDCGTNLGQGLQKISDLENIDDLWTVYSFEPNPHTFLLIKRNRNVRYFNVAVSDSYGFSQFNCEKWDNNGFIGGASTLIPLENWHTERVYGFRPSNIQTLVPIIDLTDFILSLEPAEKSIVLKLDIEGSEYKILKKFQELNLFKYINKLYIEFHDHLLQSPGQFPASYWLDFFSSINLKFTIWD